MLKRNIVQLRPQSTNVSSDLSNCWKKWTGVVGLEVHAQLNTVSKLFSGASTKYGGTVNNQVALFDAAVPGTLPVLNKKCVESAVLTALALNCTIHETSWFDRKHYFYADLPAGYQITQQRFPFATNGKVRFQVVSQTGKTEPYLKEARIKQIQLEQDSGKSLHDTLKEMSLVDLNRAGNPLMELVFEPDLCNGEEAAALIKELTLILEQLDTCSCKIQEGALRVDANVSVRPKDSPNLGIRSEVKNIGGIKAVLKAVQFELNRHVTLLEAGEPIINETRAWDAVTECTVPMRDKETVQDYRFMPEPNLPPLKLSLSEQNPEDENILRVTEIQKRIPVLPDQLRKDLQSQYTLPAPTVMRLLDSRILLKIFQGIMKGNPQRDPKQISNILMMDVLAALYREEINPEECTVNTVSVAETIDLLCSGKINRIIFTKLLTSVVKGITEHPAQEVQENNWWQVDDEELIRKYCVTAVDENPSLVKLCQKAGKKRKAAVQSILNIITNRNEKLNLKLTKQIIENVVDTRTQT